MVQANNEKLMSLPIFKNFNANEISTTVEKWRKGEKPVYNTLKLATIAGLGYAVCKYVLPPVFVAIGAALAAVATCVIVVAAIVAAPLIFKVIRKLVRAGHKAIIKYDPFGELYAQLEKMKANALEVVRNKGKILGLKNDMQIEAERSEKEAEKMQKDILRLQAKAESKKAELAQMVADKGPNVKNEDEYVNGYSELTKMLSDANRLGNQLAQSKDFIIKYGSRAAIMKKFAQKLTLAETAMDIKIADFEATIQILQKDYEFSKKARTATDAAKSAMLFDKSWELEYALDVVTSTIAEDISITSSNMKDIDTLTSQYSLDNDDLYTNLNLLAEGIKLGTDMVPASKVYANPEYKLTEGDKRAAGGFEEITF